MKKRYASLLFLVLLASCSPHLITQGITDEKSNYIVTTAGKQINAASVKVNNNAVTADTARYTLNDVSAIKIGQAYWGVQDGAVYDGIYYGKLMLLRRYAGYEYDMSTHTSHAVYHYYLQKQGQAEIDDLTNRNLIDDVQDDPLALRKARAAAIYTDVTYASCITAIAGLSCVFLPYSSRFRKPAVTAGLFAMPVFLITLPIGPHKKFKAVRVYNE
jgi:hypothetical protein